MPSNMDPTTEAQPASRSRRAEQSERHSNNSASQSTPPSYGYHNTFHTHATPVLASPPSYEVANSAKTLTWAYTKHMEEAEQLWNNTSPPPYECTVFKGGIMGMKQELTAIFQVSRSRDWHDVYVVLEGTQLNVHRVKSPGILSKHRSPVPGRLIRSFTLQHSEIGVASDFKKTPLTPKSPFAHLVPGSARHKLYETDPHLFEPVREHVIRLRLETEQFLLCASSQEEMLDWSEKLCAAIDISQPLEDRSEPRYRSLPRRSRRQRVLDGSRLGENLENLSSLEAGRRMIAEQEEIIRQLYPHLAGTSSAPQLPDLDLSNAPADADREEFDAEDVRFPSRRPGSSSLSRTVSNEETAIEDRPTTREMYPDPKDAPMIRPSQSQILRYRRRCAPALLACSPRVSDVVMCGGERVRINTRENVLVTYTSHPPRYDAHNFPKAKRAPKVPKPIPAPIHVERPSSPLRGVSDTSIESFGYDLSSTSSDSAAEEIRAGAPSEPPSPTALTQAKADAARQLVSIGKHRRSGDEVRETGMSAMALGVAGLMV
ncbi:uncharacterized protein N0V89_003282 [Didymosphaeria variabile]|uniref:PH domain-containing protein n=1 Tax=Didymosphaeria variabile TaxID=1932322 RepID=A0A9W8XVT4_9PLEO|nr:uncharacterized protein N0V89_003282 [Didymosphaeria variabile]KAJ4358698.1 hypothetical protein N0V89_003282 [Didymosphaeria variabile]